MAGKVMTVDYAAAFGKAAITLGDAAHKAWNQDAWQVLGIKDRTATQRADANGKGGTRAAMLQIAHYGFDNAGLATQAAAYVRNRYYGNTSLNTAGISFTWLAVASNLADIAPNAQFKADSKGTMRMTVKARTATASKPKVARKAASADSVNGPVVVVKVADVATVEADA